MEKGKGANFRGRSLNEIELRQDVYYSSESEDESKGPSQTQAASEKVEEHVLPSTSKAPAQNKIPTITSTRTIATKGTVYF